MGTVTRMGGLMDQRDEDWRDTLFYWHGKLSWVGGERNVTSWRGTWLSTVSNTMPAFPEFASSFNFFELNFDVKNSAHASELSHGKWNLHHFLGLSGDFRGHYLMEPPDGAGYRRAYRDEGHEFCFDLRLTDVGSSGEDEDVAMAETSKTPTTNNALMDAMFPVMTHLRQQRQQASPLPPGPYVLCAARGANEFGSFVALGHARRTRGGNSAGLCPQAVGTGLDDGVELTLARRYVRDDDSRLKWPLPELLNSVQSSPTRRSRVAPWEHSLPCRLPSDVIAADARRTADFENTMADDDDDRRAHERAGAHGQASFYAAEMQRKRPRD